MALAYPGLLAGVALRWLASGHLECLVEYYRTLNADPEERERMVNLCLRHELCPHPALLAAVGPSPGGSASERTRQIAYLGLQVAH